MKINASPSGYTNPTAYTEGGASVAFADTDTTITDADSTSMSRLTAKVNNEI